MQAIDKTDYTMEFTRGDRVTITIINESDEFRMFEQFKLSIVERKNYKNVVFQKTYIDTRPGKYMYLTLTENETRFLDIENKGKEFWYELEFEGIDTFLGYDGDGGKRLIVYPESPMKGAKYGR